VAAKLDTGLAELSRDLGVDVLSLGGAKNGLMNAEAVVIFNAPDSELPRMQKQAMQLISKMRYVSGQFIPYLTNEHWRVNASNANSLAQRLANGLKQRLGERLILTQAVDTNQLFCILPDEVKQKLRNAGHVFYDWNTPGEVRFVTSWDSTEQEVDAFLQYVE
jgi:threonine aldolase